MILRRVLKFNSTLGFTIPREYSEAMGLHWKDYVEILFIDEGKILIRKHRLSDQINGVLSEANNNA